MTWFISPEPIYLPLGPTELGIYLTCSDLQALCSLRRSFASLLV